MSDTIYLNQDTSSSDNPKFLNAPTGGAGGDQLAVPVIGADFASGTNFESANIDGMTYIRLRQRVLFDYTSGRTVTPATDTESNYGWTWKNGTALSLADENDTVTDGLHMTHGTTNTTHTTSTQTAPIRYKQYTNEFGYKQWICRLSMSGTANGDFVGIHAEADGGTARFVRMGIEYDGADHYIHDTIGGTTSGTDVLMTAGQLTAGIWVRIIVSDNNVRTEYSVTDQATPPNDWTLMGTAANYFQYSDTVFNAGFIFITGGTAGTATGKITYYDDFYAKNKFDYSGADPCWGATLPHTSSETGGDLVCQLIADWDLGSATATVDDTFLQQLLGDLVNAQDWASATIEFSSVQSASTGASAGSYTAASLVSTGGSGTYWNLFMKVDASSNLFGTLGGLPAVVRVS